MQTSTSLVTKVLYISKNTKIEFNALSDALDCPIVLLGQTYGKVVNVFAFQRGRQDSIPKSVKLAQAALNNLPPL